MKREFQLGVFGGLLVLAIVAVVLSAALYPTQWGLFVLLPYVLLPVTAAACAAIGDDEELSIWANFGCFFEAFFWVSTVAVPSLLYRVDAINGSQLGWLLAADARPLSALRGSTRPMTKLRTLPARRGSTVSNVVIHLSHSLIKSLAGCGKHCHTTPTYLFDFLVGDGVNAYYVFKVTSETFSVEPIQVDRRYSDFLWLHTQLARQCAGYIIPPLPAKLVPLLQGPEFLERRRAGLEKFLLKVVEHDELKNTNAFKSFLECSPVELTAIKTEAQRQEQGGGAQALVAQKSQQLNSWWGKAYQRMAENDKVKLLAAKAGRELHNANVIEDAEFDRLAKYVSDLHALVKTMQSRAQHAHKQNKLAAGAYCELIESMSAIADIEQSSPSGASASAPSDFGAVLTLLDTRARLVDAELASFAESVDYFARWVGAVVNAVNVREDRRFVYQAKLAAAQTTGAGTNNNDVLEAKDDFERVHARVVNEVKKFQVEKSMELRRLFAQYARVQADTHSELAAVIEVTTKALEGPVNTHPFAATTKRPFFSVEPSNQQDAEQEETLRKMSVGPKSDAKTKEPAPGNETADLYSDVCL